MTGKINAEEAEGIQSALLAIAGGVVGLIGIIASIRAREKQITNAQFSAMKRR